MKFKKNYFIFFLLLLIFSIDSKAQGQKISITDQQISEIINRGMLAPTQKTELNLINTDEHFQVFKLPLDNMGCIMAINIKPVMGNGYRTPEETGYTTSIPNKIATKNIEADQRSAQDILPGIQKP